MDDGIARLERRVAELARAVGDLQARVASLEESRSADGSRMAAVAAAEATGIGAVPETPSHGGWLGLPATLSLTGRTFLALGGAFLLRAITEGGVVGAAPGVALGVPYAFLWLALANRAAARGQRTSAVFHCLTAALIAFPLLWEASARFAVLGPGGQAAGVITMAVLGLGLAVRRELGFPAWVFAVGATVILVARAFRGPVGLPDPWLLVLMGGLTLAVAWMRGWGGPRWPVALAADIAVLRVALLAASEPELRATAIAFDVAGARLLLSGLIVVYLGAFVLSTLVREREVGAFEILQSALVLGIGLWGFAGIARVGGAGTVPIGAIALVVGAASYAVAFALVRRKRGRCRNFFYYGTLGGLLVLAGGALLGERSISGGIWSAVAVIAAFVGGRFDRVTLRAHAAVFALAAAEHSGLLGNAAGALAGPADAARAGLGGPALVALVACAASYATLVATRGHRTKRGLGRAPRAILALLSALGIGGLAASGGARALGDLATPGFIAAIRTFVLAASAVGLAAARRRAGLAELGWLAAAALVAGGLKLALEDLRAGTAISLFPAFACYGLALILVPRILRRGGE